LVADSDGNLYGTASEGGAYGAGTIFELAADGSEKTLYTFTGGSDGARPVGTLAFDSQGNLYGTANFGGIAGCYDDLGCGMLYELESNGAFTVLYSFCSQPKCTDGYFPESRLIADDQGNLYGTTFAGGTSTGCYLNVGCGVVYKFALGSGTETVKFTFNGRDGGNLEAAGVLLDNQGDLYGTAIFGGKHNKACNPAGCGVVYEILANGTEKTLQYFKGANGANSQSDLISDPAGNIYGTSDGGGADDFGTIWKVEP
jgi:uncharacterized repeat protein (TIGR03803 family)